jgi:hypothetical protein
MSLNVQTHQACLKCKKQHTSTSFSLVFFIVFPILSTIRLGIIWELELEKSKGERSKGVTHTKDAFLIWHTAMNTSYIL